MAIEKREGKRGIAYKVRVDVGIDPVTNKRTFRTSTFGLLKEAEKQEREWKSDVDKGMLTASTRKVAEGQTPLARRTVKQHLESWLSEMQPNIRETTYNAYQDTVTHLIREIGSVRLVKLSPANVQNAYARMRKEGHSPVVIGKCHLRLNQALKQAVRLQLISRNVCEAVEPPRVKTATEKAVWTVEQTRAFLTASESDALFPLWPLAISTGMRRGELLGLRWGDVDFPRDRVYIRQSVTVGAGGKPIITEPKTMSGRRTITLPPSMMRLLTAYKASQRPDGDESLLFHTATGEHTPINPTNLRRNMTAICKRAGVPELTPHGMRHTSATLMLASGAHVKAVQARLGHADSALTMRTYNHLLPSVEEAATDALAQVLE